VVLGREPLRATFDAAAELYDRARPGYPPALFDDLAALAGLGPGTRVLEIGPGTGQATAALAGRGCEVVAVELGPELAAVARRNLAGSGLVDVVTAAFETWPLPAERFDLVLAATSFHWLDPAVRAPRCAQALRPGGHLAVVATHHVAGGDQAFFAAAQACHERWDPDVPAGGARLPAAAEVPPGDDGVDGSGHFEPAVRRRYEWERPYTTAAYLDVLRTYSGHLALEPAALAGLLDCIAGRLEAHGGRVSKRYLTELRLSERA
jgi:SAM-dependent methyltransferase